MKVRADGKKIVALMMDNLLSNTELCNMANLSPYAVRSALNSNEVNPKTLGKLAKALSVEPDEIILKE
jgi:DNA-binding Xre family transcriptional regulator